MPEPLRVFVSYRRADAQDAAGRLFDWLRDEFGEEQVFLDTAHIPFGADFERVVAERMAWCSVVLVVIGPTWATLADERGRRLDQPDDPVRFELERALAAHKRVIAVRVGGAVHPGADALPASLQSLAKCNSAPLRADSFGSDFDNLLDELMGRRRGRARVEIDHLRRLVATGAGGALTALLVVPALALSAWVSVLDIIGADTAVRGHLLALAGPAPVDAVRVVAIDAASEQALGLRMDDPADRAAWRRQHARLLDRAASMQARAVVFDMVFERATEADAEFVEAARRATAQGVRVVAGAVRAGPEGIAPVLRDAAMALGHACLELRAARPAVALAAVDSGTEEQRPARAPALALAAVEAAPLVSADVDRRTLQFAAPLRAVPWEFGALEPARDRQRCEGLRNAAALAVMPIRISPPERWSQAPGRLPYAELVTGAPMPDSALTGRILVVGATGTLKEHDDQHAVVGQGMRTRRVWGVELQADAIATLLAPPVPRSPTADLQAGTALGMGLLGVVLSGGLFVRPPWQRRAALAVAVVAWLALVAVLAGQGLLLQPVYDVMALFAGYGVARWLQQRARASRGLRGVEQRQKEQQT